YRTRQEMAGYYQKALELEKQKEQQLQLPEPNRILLETIVEEHAEFVRRSNASLVSLTRAREVATATRVVLLEVQLREALEAAEKGVLSKSAQELRFTTELGAANTELERQLAEARQELKTLAATRGELDALEGGLADLRQQATDARARAET